MATVTSFESELKPETRPGDAISRQIALAAAATSVFITWSIILISNPSKSGWFALHPTLQILAVLLFTFGIITLQPTNQPKTKLAGLARHQIAIFVGLPFIVLGTVAVYYNKVLHGADHFTTWHGSLGIFCMAWLFFQISLGAGSVWYGGALFGGGMKAKAIWKYHRLSGYMLFPLILFTVHLGGAWSTWGSKYAFWSVRFLAYTVGPLGIILGVYARVRTFKMPII